MNKENAYAMQLYGMFPEFKDADQMKVSMHEVQAIFTDA